MQAMQEMLDKLNPMQKQAVLHTEGPLLLLAGAGSGKTRVLTHRIAYMIEQGVNPFNILAITFTNKAAREMKERVSAISPRGDEVWVSTFHSTCVRLLRREIDKIGYSSQFSIYDSSDSERLIKNILKELNISDKVYPPKYICSEIGTQKDNLIGPKQYAMQVENDFRLKKVAEIYNIYQQRLEANNALDFDDLIFKTVELFKLKPEILEKYQERFKYIMVDEYQDTNTSQYKLIRLLSAKYNNLCVVGDDDQSIYGWRGANIRNILDFEKDFKNAVTIKLEQNYRSTDVILDTANKVISNNSTRKSKNLWTEATGGEPIHYYQANSDLEEARFVAIEIKKHTALGTGYNNFAVLYRNNALSRSIEESFVKHSIPYRLLGGTRFYDRKEIMDVLAYLKALYNPADDMQLRRIINVPKRGIGNATVDKVADYSIKNNQSFFDTLKQSASIPELKTKAKTLSAFLEIFNDLLEKATELNISELISYIIEETGYKKELLAENTDEALGRLDNIAELINKAVEFEKSNPDNPSLSAFLEEVALVADIDGYSTEEDTVVLMTLHSSKGLEFPTVFIIGFEDSIFPSYRSIIDESPTALEEERRLCYVGITRAKNNLYLTGAKSRLQHGQYVSNSPSRFLKEIPKENMVTDKNSAPNSQNQQQRSFSTKASYTGNAKKSYHMPSPKDVNIDLEVGDKVRQIKYGAGDVVAIDPAGADYEITVHFEKYGNKKFMAKFSNLKKI